MKEIVNTKEWSRGLWRFIHCMCSVYSNTPSEPEKISAIKFIESLEYIIPCSECRIHYSNYIKNYNLSDIVSAGQKLETWFFDFHNDVNKRLNKPLLKRHEFMKMYPRENCKCVQKINVPPENV